MEAVRQQLVGEGHTGIPKNVVRLFEVLKDHNLLTPTPEGESVWQAEIIDPAKNWNQKLTFLRFPNSIIWPTKNPEYFDGQIKPVGESENLKASISAHPVSNEPVQESSSPQEKLTADRNLPQSIESKVSQRSLFKEEDASQRPFSQPANTPQQQANQVRRTNLQSEFITWLISAIERRLIRVNEPKAPVHVLDAYIALVSPAIFNTYFDKNPIKRKLYEERAENKKIFTFLQKELESLGIHEVSKGGQNIHTVTVEGERKVSELKVYLLPRTLFPTLKNFSPNRAIKGAP